MLALGCTPAAVAPPPAPRVAAKPVVAPPASTSTPATSQEDATEDASAPPADGKAGEAEEESKGEQSAKSDPTPVPAERIAILTPGGPLLVDVRLTLDGQPFGAALAKLVDEVLAAADSDGDGRPTWKELADNEKFLAKKMPDSTRSRYMLLNDWLEKHDVNGDDRIQPDEAASWLGRDAGRTARAFALRTSRAYSPDPRTTSRMWPLLDTDRDGRLSADELAGASQQLWLCDADDDRVIALSELASLRDQLNAAAGMPMGMRQTSGPASARLAALHLEPKSDLERVDYVLQDMYSPLQELAPKSFAALPKLFGQLDANGDEWLEREELASLRTIPAHIELAVSFDRHAKEAVEAAHVDVTSHADELAALPGATSDRVQLVLEKTRLVLAVQDLTARQSPNGRPALDPEAYADADPSLEQTQVRLVVHDESDAVFDELDANADGRLGEREVATASQRLARYDANEDGQITAEETPYEMIVAIVRGEALSERSFTTPPSAAADSDAKAPAWFAFADLNRDGDVSRREFVGSTAQFAALDANADGFIAAAEAAATNATSSN